MFMSCFEMYIPLDAWNRFDGEFGGANEGFCCCIYIKSGSILENEVNSRFSKGTTHISAGLAI